VGVIRHALRLWRAADGHMRCQALTLFGMSATNVSGVEASSLWLDGRTVVISGVVVTGAVLLLLSRVEALGGAPTAS
jgi:hypothetical protein